MHSVEIDGISGPFLPSLGLRTESNVMLEPNSEKSAGKQEGGCSRKLLQYNLQRVILSTAHLEDQFMTPFSFEAILNYFFLLKCVVE